MTDTEIHEALIKFGVILDFSKTNILNANKVHSNSISFFVVFIFIAFAQISCSTIIIGQNKPLNTYCLPINSLQVYSLAEPFRYVFS